MNSAVVGHEHPFGGKYVLGALLGKGGMGLVYAATQCSLSRQVAIKMPRAELSGVAVATRCLRREGIALARVQHPNVVGVIDLGEHQGVPYLVMERLEGSSLDSWRRAEAPLSLATTVAIIGELLDVLHEAHAVGIVHGDIKPDNIRITRSRSGVLELRLFDFGLARMHDDDGSLDDGKVLYGTPEYIAPELARGQRPTSASDLYAVGVVLYELLTGTLPFTGSSSEILARHVHEPIDASAVRQLTALPALDAVLCRALAKDPQARYPDAAAFSMALHESAALSPFRLNRKFPCARRIVVSTLENAREV